MTTLLDLLTRTAAGSWDMLAESAPYMLLGLFAAGCLKAFVSESFVAAHLGRGTIAPVLKASLLGVPIPLCSCGVIPAAAALRRQGASKGATAAFLISTPETGVDSVAVTYALMDPFMTVIRPLAAFLTATAAGLAVNFSERGRPAAFDPFAAPLAPLQPMPTPCTGAGCGCGAAGQCAPTTLAGRLKAGLAYAFGELLGDIGAWFLLGVVLAGLIAALIPDDLLAGGLGRGPLAMLLALVVAAPMYVCATASTPMAAALAAKGLSPGACLVFLLAGPATNAATLTVMARLLGRRAAVFSLAALIVCTLALGLAADAAFLALHLSTAAWRAAGPGEVLGAVEAGSAVLLLLLVLRARFPRLRLGRKPAPR